MTDLFVGPEPTPCRPTPYYRQRDGKLESDFYAWTGFVACAGLSSRAGLQRRAGALRRARRCAGARSSSPSSSGGRGGGGCAAALLRRPAGGRSRSRADPLQALHGRRPPAARRRSRCDRGGSGPSARPPQTGCLSGGAACVSPAICARAASICMRAASHRGHLRALDLDHHQPPPDEDGAGPGGDVADGSGDQRAQPPLRRACGWAATGSRRAGSRPGRPSPSRARPSAPRAGGRRSLGAPRAGARRPCPCAFLSLPSWPCPSLRPWPSSRRAGAAAGAASGAGAVSRRRLGERRFSCHAVAFLQAAAAFGALAVEDEAHQAPAVELADLARSRPRAGPGRRCARPCRARDRLGRPATRVRRNSICSPIFSVSGPASSRPPPLRSTV